MTNSPTNSRRRWDRQGCLVANARKNNIRQKNGGRKMANDWGQANEKSIRLPPVVCHFSALSFLAKLGREQEHQHRTSLPTGQGTLRRGGRGYGTRTSNKPTNWP